MNSLLALGKYLDQPRLVAKFSKAVPAILVAGGTAYTCKQVYEAPKEEKNKEFIKSVSALTGTILSALVATRGIPKLKIGEKMIFKGFHGLSEHLHEHEHEHVHLHNINFIQDFINNNNLTKDTRTFLNKAKNEHLSFSQIKTVFEEITPLQNGKKFLDKLVPNPEEIDSKHIFGEIKRLSLMGLVPVLGGISGGIIGDKLTEKNWKEKIPNKIKEGTYQFLANIFLCNVGAGAALWAMEKTKIQSRPARAIGMLGGIILAGVVFGSSVANLIGKTFIDPLVGNKHKNEKNCIYDERKPEFLDVGLHIDDIATVTVLSGLKWIEPALPILYSISGYRAGIGYRNGEEQKG